MKQFLCIVGLLLISFCAAMAAPVLTEVVAEEPAGITIDVSTFTGIVALVSMIVTQIAKVWKKVDESSLIKRAISAVVGIAAFMICWALQVAPMFEGMVWWWALIYGALAGLSASGFYALIKDIWKYFFPDDPVIKTEG